MGWVQIIPVSPASLDLEVDAGLGFLAYLTASKIYKAKMFSP